MGLNDRFDEAAQAGGIVDTKEDLGGRAVPFLERLEVSQGLSPGEHPKGEGLSGDVDIPLRLGHQLQEQAAGRSAFIELAGGVQVAGAIAEGRRNMMVLEHPPSKLIDEFFYLRGLGKIGHDGQVVALM